MKRLILATGIVLLLAGVPAAAQTESSEELKEAAIEALIAAPPERALPLAKKVLAGKHSVRLKEKALFILSQVDLPEAQAILMDYAANSTGKLRYEAIRMLGIGGNPQSLAEIRRFYDDGDRGTREAVLEALMIADDKAAVFDIASKASGGDFEQAVSILAAMGARDELRQLRQKKGVSAALIEACAISDDIECLLEFAADSSNPDLQHDAIQSMGIIGGKEVERHLLDAYRNAANDEMRGAALDGMLIAEHDDSVLALYRESSNTEEKKRLLEVLVMLDSEAAWSLIDAALDGDE